MVVLYPFFFLETSFRELLEVHDMLQIFGISSFQISFASAPFLLLLFNVCSNLSPNQISLPPHAHMIGDPYS